MLSMVQPFGFGDSRQLTASLSAQTGGFGQVRAEHSPGAPDLRGFGFKRTVAGKQVSLASWRPNKSFKPSPLHGLGVNPTLPGGPA